jgi:hypothetical protein
MPRIKSEEDAARREIVDWVYRWWLRGGGTLLDKDFNAKNIGPAPICTKCENATEN